MWLLGNAGYYGPPVTLPPPGVDFRMPLLENHRLSDMKNLRRETWTHSQPAVSLNPFPKSLIPNL